MTDVAWPTDHGEPIPESRILRDGTACQFCGGPKHYGWCDALREENERARRERKGRPQPLVRIGPSPRSDGGRNAEGR